MNRPARPVHIPASSGNIYQVDVQDVTMKVQQVVQKMFEGLTRTPICINPEKVQLMPESLLPEGIRSWEAKTGTPPEIPSIGFFNHLRNMVDDKLRSSNYSDGYRNMQPVTDKNGNVRFTAGEARERNVYSITIWQMINSHQEVPELDALIPRTCDYLTSQRR